ncbi:MAG TPA: hypothetical protein VFE02_12200 [Candidatus Acidoferrales bacterium]|jgi:hypothetical protein|nr:hypothetical protein [Candidatus Acidoferrales bacterium]
MALYVLTASGDQPSQLTIGHQTAATASKQKELLNLFEGLAIESAYKHGSAIRYS